MFNFIKNLFDQIFPLKDDPRRGMDLVYQHTIRFGKAITPILAQNEREQTGIAYQLNHGLQNYYSDEVNNTLRELGLDPSRVTENQLKQYGSELFKAAITAMLSESGLFYEISSRRGRAIIEAFDSHLMNHDLDFNSLFPDHTESSIAKMSASKALSLYIEALKPHGILPIAISIKAGYLLSTIEFTKINELDKLEEQFGIEFGIEPFLHPLYYDIFSDQKDFQDDNEKENQHDECSSPENYAEENDGPPSAHASHFLDDAPNSKLSNLPFMQAIFQAHEALYPLLALSDDETEDINLAYLNIKSDILSVIENDVWNYLLHFHQSITEARLDALTDEMINTYLKENQLFMHLGNMMMAIPYSIQIDLIDTYTLVEEVIDRLEKQGITIPAEIEDLLEDVGESMSYDQIMTQLTEFLLSHQLTLVMFETGEDHSFYFLIKHSHLNQILALSNTAQLSAKHIHN